eukprot:COSAG02_NODE_1600_length_11742_cov_33.722838_9_plen_106_part_00
MYPGQVDAALGGQKAGAVARTGTFLIVLWIFLFERMRAAEDKEKVREKAQEPGLGAGVEAATSNTAEGQSSSTTKEGGSASAMRKRAGEGDSQHKGGGPTVEIID